VDRAVRDGRLYVSCISVWEVALLVATGRLRLTMDVESWIARSEALPFLNFVPVDNRIALRSTQLPGALHRDPADRMIIATTVVLGAELVTKDDKLRRYAHVRTLW
jgi:PIN domain nuclease of toxin-antitoxin system